MFPGIGDKQNNFGTDYMYYQISNLMLIKAFSSCVVCCFDGNYYFYQKRIHHFWLLTILVSSIGVSVRCKKATGNKIIAQRAHYFERVRYYGIVQS
jgi:hypothetical protein